MADAATAKVVADYILRRDAQRERERAKLVAWHRRRASERQGLPLGPDEGDVDPLEPLALPDPPPAVPVDVTVTHKHEKEIVHERNGDSGSSGKVDWCRLAVWLMGLGLLLLLFSLLLWALGAFGGDTIINTGAESAESLFQWLEDEKRHLP